MQKLYLLLLFIAGGSLNACQEEIQQRALPDEGNTTTPLPDNSNLLFGNPSNASDDDENNYRIDKTYYVVSYNKSKAIPNWVSWHLGNESLGTFITPGTPKTDPALPASWFHAENYAESGFTEGQNCPVTNRTVSAEANATTYFMTNMMPLVAENKAWKAFDDYIVSLVKQGNEAYIISGSYGAGATGAKGFANKILNDQVTVPAHLWKVVVLLKNDVNDLNRVNPNTRIITIDLLNTAMESDAWLDNRVSVDAIEAATGLDLLSALPNLVEDAVEAKVDKSGITDPGTDPVDNDNMAFGNPSHATAEVTNEENYLMVKTYYALSYSRSRAIPNWVSWYLGESSIGSIDRSDNFKADNTLPSAWYHASSTSYTNSGFTRGHNCPSGDRTATKEANDATFLMTNMIPQAAQNNGGLWSGLEVYARTQITAGNEVYIIMGSYGKGGEGDKGYAETIDNGNITVPKYIWKVAVIIPKGDNDVSRVSASTRVIAIITPNVNSGLKSWGTYRVTVDEIEAATGYDILSALPDNIENVIEAKVDTGSV